MKLLVRTLLVPTSFGPYANLLQAVETPDSVAVCQLLSTPDAFNGRIVSIRAVIALELEQFEIIGQNCPSTKVRDIWLEYGKGPKSQPTTWCCGDLAPRDPLGLVQDASFRQFDAYLRAQRQGKPKYRVTATLTGRFDSVPVRLCPDQQHYCPSGGGFGHLGVSAARLVIHRVSNVATALR